MASMEYQTRNGAITAVNTMTNIVNIGSTASAAVTPNVKAKTIKQVIIAVSGDSAVVGAASFTTRLFGTGIVPNQQDFAAGSQGGTLATGAATQVPPTVIPTSIDVNPPNTILIQGSMNEVDIGTAAMVVTLGFELA